MENTIATTATPNLNKDVLKTLRQISLIFFFIIGGTHILTGLFSSQSLFLPLSNIVNRVLDIPFVIIATIFGLSQVRLNSENPSRKLYFVLMIIISLLVLGLLLYINLLIPDRSIPST